MSFEDFMKTWDRLYVCHLTPASFLSEIDKDVNVYQVYLLYFFIIFNCETSYS